MDLEITSQTHTHTITRTCINTHTHTHTHLPKIYIVRFLQEDDLLLLQTHLKRQGKDRLGTNPSIGHHSDNVLRREGFKDRRCEHK